MLAEVKRQYEKFRHKKNKELVQLKFSSDKFSNVNYKGLCLDLERKKSALVLIQDETGRIKNELKKAKKNFRRIEKNENYKTKTETYFRGKISKIGRRKQKIISRNRRIKSSNKSIRKQYSADTAERKNGTNRRTGDSTGGCLK